VKVLLDADVLIGALDRNDPHHRRARQLFTTWRDGQDACLISIVSLTEVLVAPSADVSTLAAAREAIAALGVTAHQPNEAIAVDAARFRQRHPISLPDAQPTPGSEQGTPSLRVDHLQGIYRRSGRLPLVS
jgi:predicted nucleic acid-binding protein